MTSTTTTEERSSSRPPIGDPIVEAMGLRKTFTDFWMRAKARAVDGVDFQIRRHEIFGLLGPNGSGKSTTIKMILGLLNKSSGRLSVFGREPSDVAIKAKIGYLPEESYLYRYLDARETLDYYGRIFGLDRRNRMRRIDELLEMVGLAQVKRRSVGEYSKGMSRRLGLAQALINDPELLILDEPTSGLDPIGTRQVKDLLLELGNRGTTILLSSHLLADVEDVCDRMVILYGGRIHAEGTTEELLADRERTVIHTGTLGDGVIAEIDQVLHRHGQAVDAVERPRQRLEELFMGIVEEAQAKDEETSGAVQGGATAAFLSEEADVGGDDLLDSLQRDDVEPTSVREKSHAGDGAATTKAGAEAAEVVRDLVEEAPTPPSGPPSSSSTPATDVPDRPADHDASMIDDLLGSDDDGGDGTSRS